jgi:hypothetical protein
MKKAVAMHQKSPRVNDCLLNFLNTRRIVMNTRASGKHTHNETHD